MQKFRRTLAALACLVVGVASFALSYVALRDVAVALGAVPEGLGWLVPIVIDGGIICGSAIIWSLSKEQGGRPKFPFLFVGAMVIMSVIVNVAHAGESILAKVIAGLPPLILLGTLELVADQGRRSQKEETVEGAAPLEASAEAPLVIAPEASVPQLSSVGEAALSAPAELTVAPVAPEAGAVVELPQPRTELSVVKEEKPRAPRATKAAPKSSTRSTTTRTSTSTAKARTAKTAVAAMNESVKEVTAAVEKAPAKRAAATKAEKEVPSAEEAKKAARPARASTTRPLRVSAAAPEDS